jgi:hypothetical protein
MERKLKGDTVPEDGSRRQYEQDSRQNVSEVLDIYQHEPGVGKLT